MNNFYLPELEPKTKIYRNETHKYICTFGYEEGPERYCPAKNLSCGVLPPTECPELPPVLSFECLDLVCDLAWSEAQTISPPSLPLPNSTLPAIPTVPNSTLPAMPPIPSSNMVKDPEHSTDWIFFVGGTLFAVFFFILVYVLYKHCCKKEQQQALPFFNLRAARERREEEKIAVVADDKPGETVRNGASPVRLTPKIPNSQINLNVSAEEINTPQIVSPSGSLDRTSTSSDSVEKDLSDNSSGSRVGVLPRQKEDRVPLALLAGTVPKGKIFVREDSEPDTDSAGSDIDPAGIKIDPSKTDNSSAAALSADKLSIAIEQAKKKILKCK